MAKLEKKGIADCRTKIHLLVCGSILLIIDYVIKGKEKRNYELEGNQQ